MSILICTLVFVNSILNRNAFEKKNLVLYLVWLILFIRLTFHFIGFSRTGAMRTLGEQWFLMKWEWLMYVELKHSFIPSSNHSSLLWSYIDFSDACINLALVDSSTITIFMNIVIVAHALVSRDNNNIQFNLVVALRCNFGEMQSYFTVQNIIHRVLIQLITRKKHI